MGDTMPSAVGEAILIDPVISSMERDRAELHRLGLKLAWTLDTHIHADHITAALELKHATGSRIAAPAFDRLPCADTGVEEGKPFTVAGITLQPLHTLGHLLIEGCGRTDFQNGDADALYRSVTEKLFTLPDETLIYPAHDYKERFVSSIAQESKGIPAWAKARAWMSSRRSWPT
jgi:glyoxylase-like metal-dependent hydrolase (beta-lactamase superfamily II)